MFALGQTSGVEFSQFSMRGYGGVLGVKLPALKGIGVCPGRRQGGALGDFCNFSMKITHLYEYFGQNSF